MPDTIQAPTHCNLCGEPLDQALWRHMAECPDRTVVYYSATEESIQEAFDEILKSSPHKSLWLKIGQSLGLSATDKSTDK